MQPTRTLFLSCGLLVAACTQDTTSVSEMEAQIGTRLAQGPEAAFAEPDRPQVILSEGFATALRTAVAANDGYLAAQAFEEEAFANIDVAKSARRPQLSASGTIGAVREGDPVDETMQGLASDLSLTQVVYDAGASRGAINRATATALAAQAARIDRGNQLALEAATAWANLWVSAERVALLADRTGNLDELMDQMERMASNGLMDRASVENAKRQVLDIQVEQTGLEADLRQARIGFAQAFQTQRGAVGAPPQLVSGDILRTRADAWEDAPALRQAAAELIAAQRAEDEARAAFRPSVSLRAGVTSPMDDDETTDVSGGVFVQYVFADGGRRRAALEAATKRVAALEAGLTAAQLATETEIDTSFAQLEALDRSLRLVNQKIRLSTSEADVARSQIATGQANLRQLISTEIEAYRALDQRLQLEGERYLLRLTIAARSGYLSDVIGLAP